MDRRWVNVAAWTVGLSLFGVFAYEMKRVQADEGAPPGKPKVVQRSKVMRAEDTHAWNIDPKSKPTTVANLLAAPRPEGLHRSGHAGDYHDKRVAPLETTVWHADVTVLEIVEREDNDYYLVLEDSSGARCVAELPRPEDCSDSRFHAEIKRTRAELYEMFRPSRQPQRVDRRARITGLGFFGRASKGNGARFQPLIDVAWLDEQR